MDGHSLDWAGQPDVYKTYSGLEPVGLSREPRFPGTPLSALFQQSPATAPKNTITAEDLSALLLLTYSLTAKTRHPGGDFYYRSVASAGALYPAEIYTALAGIDGLEDGLYHFSIARHGLTRLRSGNEVAFLKPDRPESRAAGPQLIFFLTAIFFRSSWKYRDRAFRYHLLDTGHVLEHLVLSLRALSLPYRLTFDFGDSFLGRFLGLDENREAPLALCLVNTAEVAFSAASSLEPLPADFEQTGRVSPREVGYPLIREAYQAGRTFQTGTAPDLNMATRLGPLPASWSPCPAPPPGTLKTPLKQAVFSRRSRRNYVTTPLGQESWQALWGAMALSAGEELAGMPLQQILAAGCLAGRVEGVSPGFYLLDGPSRSLGLCAPGTFTASMAHVCLDQAWLAQAAVHFCFLTNLRLLEEQWGARGYRYAMLQAGRLGERLYLTAAALGLGCCGIGALYDQEAADLLGLNEDSRLLYLVAVGPVKSSR
jgi:SagB-type dehydrogenase family enzyme